VTYVADQEPQGLTELTSVEDNDTVIVGDTSDASEVVKRISWANLKTLIQTFVEGLTSYFNVSSDTSDAITQGSTNLFLTSAERTKLSGVEAGATADQSGSEIVTAVNTELGGRCRQRKRSYRCSRTRR